MHASQVYTDAFFFSHSPLFLLTSETSLWLGIQVKLYQVGCLCDDVVCSDSVPFPGEAFIYRKAIRMPPPLPFLRRAWVSMIGLANKEGLRAQGDEEYQMKHVPSIPPSPSMLGMQYAMSHDRPSKAHISSPLKSSRKTCRRRFFLLILPMAFLGMCSTTRKTWGIL